MLANALSAGPRSGKPSALLLVDLEGFRRVNRSLGHAVGDDLLAVVGQRLQRVSGISHLGLFGGDVFTVVLAEAQSILDVSAAVEQVHAVIGEECRIKDLTLLLTARIGVAVGDENVDADGLFRQADAALALAKERGVRTQFFDSSMARDAARSLRLESRLVEAMVRGDLEMHYQPIVRASDERVACLEALMRWTDAELGPVSPDEFIPVALARGLLPEFADFVAREVTHTRQRLARAVGNPDLRVSMNISPEQLRDYTMLPRLQGMVAEAGESCEHFILEVTEELVRHPDRLLPALARFQQAGFSVALDDFGTGAGSLSNLSVIEGDILKIDKSFIDPLTTDVRARALVKGLLTMSGAMGMISVAEGVETDEQRVWLIEHGCDELQGFIYSPALTVDQIEAGALAVAS